jgi:hypothetical protein
LFLSGHAFWSIFLIDISRGRAGLQAGGSINTFSWDLEAAEKIDFCATTALSR